VAAAGSSPELQKYVPDTPQMFPEHLLCARPCTVPASGGDRKLQRKRGCPGRGEHTAGGCRGRAEALGQWGRRVLEGFLEAMTLAQNT